jgi:hypothetical protein
MYTRMYCSVQTRCYVAIANRQVPMAKNQHTTVEKILQTVFSTMSVSRVISAISLEVSSVVVYELDDKDISCHG